MKKIIKTLLVVMVVALALAAFTACEVEDTTEVCQHEGGTATCTEQAVCEKCGVSYGPVGHKTEVLPALAATCAKEGRTEGAYCKVCKEVLVEQQTIAKLEHVWVANEDRDFTCTLDGLVGGNHCENCGIQDGTIEIVPAHCVWGEEYVYSQPTCGATGIIAHDCTVCGAKEKVADIPATGEHSFTIDVPALDPTCAEDGYTACKMCEVCGAPNEEYEVIPATGDHVFNDEDIFYYPEPTCTEGGYLAGYCATCGGGFYLEELPPSHKDEDGDNKCDVCEEEIPVVHEHEWTDATCVAPKTCATCGETEGEALGHDWAAATCVAPKTCSVCGETEGEALGHDYDHITHDATCTEAGYVEHICAICDDTYTDGETEALGHADENGDYKCDRCSTKMLPADGTVLTVEQALAIAQLGGSSYTTQKYYITGIVSGLYNTTYGNFYIKDTETGKEICIYGLYSADGTTRYDAMSYKPVNGDEVTVYTVLGTYNGTAQGKNAWLDEVVHNHTYTDATCTAPATCSCGETQGEALGHNYVEGVCANCNGADPDYEGEVSAPTYVKVTSADQITTGTYVLVVNGKVVTNFDSSSWVLTSAFSGSGDTIVSDSIATWTLTVSGTSVTLKDAKGNFIKPKSGNNNGIQSGSYNWAWAFSNGTVTFKGTGSDTTILALNNQEGKIRAYKTSTVSGNPTSYPSNFTLYKLVTE